MKQSRYALLVKLKKQSLEEAERLLLTSNRDVAGAAEQLEHAYDTLSTLSRPQSGSVGELTQANQLIRVQHTMIETSQAALAGARNRQQQARDAFHRARVDYEKFQYLEVQEMNLRMQEQKAAEAKELDEIGTMMHTRGKR